MLPLYMEKVTATFSSHTEELTFKERLPKTDLRSAWPGAKPPGHLRKACEELGANLCPSVHPSNGREDCAKPITLRDSYHSPLKDAVVVVLA